jgi:phenylacetate-CoA ligase
MKNIIDSVWIFITNYFLNTYHYLLPKDIILGNDLSKNDSKFRLYVLVIRLYIFLLATFYGRSDQLSNRLQRKRLRRLLIIANGAKWWRDYFAKNDFNPYKLKNIKDIEPLLPVTRQDLVDVEKKDFYSRQDDTKAMLWRATSGSTTGTPFSWGMDRHLIHVSDLANFFNHVYQGSDDIVKNFLSRDFYVEVNRSPNPTTSAFRHFIAGRFFVNFTSKFFTTEEGEKIKLLASSIDGNILRMLPSQAQPLIDLMKDHGYRPRPLVCAFVGESLDKKVRASVEGFFSCKVVANYGVQETGFIGFECYSHPNLYHICMDRFLVEILGDDKRRLAYGEEGVITVTCLDNTSMPLIRYQMGDLGILHKTSDFPCSCIVQTELLEIRGRDINLIKLSDGRSIPAVNILRRFNKEPFVSGVRRVQVVQNQYDAIEIILEVRSHIPREPIQRIVDWIRKFGLTVVVRQTSNIRYSTEKFLPFVPMRD